MAFIQTTDKWDAIHAVINEWLRDRTITCDNCGTIWHNGDPWCCDNPVLLTNEQLFHLIKRQNKDRKLAGNAFMSSENMRTAVSMPADLLRFLEAYCKLNHNEKLWNDSRELHAFMRRFPVFTVPDKV